MKELREVVIVDYLRTAFSRARAAQPEKDWFFKHRMDEFAAMLVKELVKRTGIKTEEIGDCVTGCAIQMGEQWLFGGKGIGLMAGLPFEVPGMGCERVCNSSASAVQIGAMEIMCGISDVAIGCGIEHMTHLPMGGPRVLEIYKHLAPIPSPKMLEAAEEVGLDLVTAMQMGLTAEKLAAEAGDITKEDMDRWSLRSHQKATKGYEENSSKVKSSP